MTTPSSSKPKVLTLNAPIQVSREYVAKMNDLVEFYVVEQAPHDELAKTIKEVVEKNGPFIAFVVFINWAEKRPYPYDEALLGPLVDSGCKLISHGGAGYDQVDIPYLTSRGVYYANTPNSASIRTSGGTAMMILQALSGSSEREADTRAGRWMNHKKMGKDVRRSTLGIIGMGNIGKLVAKHMHYFGMKIIYYNRSRLSPSIEEECGNAEYVSFDEILIRSDLLTLHCPLNDGTRHLLDKKTFEKMRDGIIIVNASRGAVIDENALVEALESGKVLRAALDVYEFEPNIHPGLIRAANTTLLPHSADSNETLAEDQETEVMANLETFIKTGKPNSPVNLAI